jgi:putative nucleotidyltransferase with HDIG domain
MDQIDELLNRVERLPPAPKLLPQLLDALARVDADIGRVVETISFDPALTVKLLQMCNSAFFGLPRRVTSVSEAVTRLGFHAVYDVVAIMSGEKFLRPAHGSQADADRLWKHAVITAFSARSLARGLGLDSELLFTAGLLHDIGKVPLVEALQGDYTALITDPTLYGKALIELEQASFGIDHASVGARLLEQWSFSAEFIACVRFHHHCKAAGVMAKLAACLEVADDLAHSLENTPGEEAPEVTTSPKARGVLKLSHKEIAVHREEIVENWHFVEAMCRARTPSLN